MTLEELAASLPAEMRVNPALIPEAVAAAIDAFEEDARD